MELLRSLAGRLKVLRLTGCEELTDFALKPLRDMTKMHEIAIGRLPHVTDEGLHFLQDLPLRRIDLTRMSQLNDASLSEVLKKRTITHLIVNGVKDLSKDLMSEIISTTEMLTEVDVSWVHAFDDELFELLIAKHSVSLRQITIWGCGRLTDIALKLAAKHYPDITVIGSQFIQ